MKIILTIIISLPIVLRDIKSGYLLFRLKDNFGHQKGLSAPQTIGKHEGKYNEYSFVLIKFRLQYHNSLINFFKNLRT